MKNAVAILTLFLTLAGGAWGQDWYSHTGFTLKRIDPATGDTVATVGSLAGVASQGRGLAVSPVTGVAYLEYQNSVFDWRLGIVDLDTGVVSDVGNHGERIRDLTFDATGKLWAVTGLVGGHALISVDTATGAVTVEAGSLPTQRNKIAYDPGTDTIFVLGWDNGDQAWQLHSLSPSAPASLTQIVLSGTALDNGSNTQRGGMGFDARAGVMLTEHSVEPIPRVEFVMISRDGVVSSAGEPVGQVYFGLDAGPGLIFQDGFESGDTLGWSSTAP